MYLKRNKSFATSKLAVLIMQKIIFNNLIKILCQRDSNQQRLFHIVEERFNIECMSHVVSKRIVKEIIKNDGKDFNHTKEANSTHVHVEIFKLRSLIETSIVCMHSPFVYLMLNFEVPDERPFWNLKQEFVICQESFGLDRQDLTFF